MQYFICQKFGQSCKKALGLRDWESHLFVNLAMDGRTEAVGIISF